MLREIVAVAAALSVQVLIVGAIPLHETLIRAGGRTVVLRVDPVDPYDPIRGYHANFTYRGIDSNLGGFDKQAPDAAPAWVVLRRGRAGEPARPVRIVRSPNDAGRDAVLRVHYVVATDTCWGDMKNAGCRSLRVKPDSWYADETAVQATGAALRQHQAVAELRVTADGDASLLRLRRSGAKMGPGG